MTLIPSKWFRTFGTGQARTLTMSEREREEAARRQAERERRGGFGFTRARADSRCPACRENDPAPVVCGDALNCVHGGER